MMKKIQKQIFSLSLLVCLVSVSSSCLNSYLDKSPDSGLSEEEVFSKYKNFKSFVDGIYDGEDTKMKGFYPMQFTINAHKFTIDALTDICDMGRRSGDANGKQGDSETVSKEIGYQKGSGKETGKIYFGWKIIRKCNIVISKIDMLQDATETEKNDLLAQAYFIRAYVNFDIYRFYGAVPYVDKVLGADDEWDLPEIGDYEFLSKVAEDFQTAADLFNAAGKMRRDPNGNLNASDQNRPSGCAALALKARALLYAASPLNNPDNDKSRWEAAAKANWEAILSAKENGYDLLPFSNYTSNYYGTRHTNEQLWSIGLTMYYPSLETIAPYPFYGGTTASGRCPTQNFVDKFETIDGYALNTETQREIATAVGSYYEQNPFVKRDPRFDIAVVYNQKPVTVYNVNNGAITPASLYVNEDGSIPAGSLIKKREGATDGVSETFYYEVKIVGGPYQNTKQTLTLSDPVIRLAELYLNYAEAVFEAYGSSSSKVEGATLTSVEALNVVRNRANMPDVRSEYLSDPEVYRSRIKNERTVELCFEGDHYYCDIRRWKDAPAIGRGKLYGLRAVKLNAGYDTSIYPTGFRYDRFELPDNRQITWTDSDGMYWVQFNTSTLIKMKNYTPKPKW